MNIFALNGNLTRDPESKVVGNGTNLTTFSIAVNHRNDTVSYFDCECFGQVAEFIRDYAKKGSSAEISGELRQDRWQDKESGGNRSRVILRVEKFSFGQGGRRRQEEEEEVADRKF